jgi:hypothetical protein
MTIFDAVLLGIAFFLTISVGYYLGVTHGANAGYQLGYLARDKHIIESLRSEALRRATPPTETRQ